MNFVSQPNALCFAVQHEALPAAAPLVLRDRDCEALADLLPVLICGEESASLVFSRLSREPHLSSAYEELTRIEREESEHARLLCRIRLALPTSRTDSALSRATKLFFLGMREQETGRHFARIAALDSGVCVMIGALCRRRTPTAAEPVLSSVFARIHRDEARHVLAARSYSRALVGAKLAREVAHDTRQRLIELLIHRAAALEQLLCVDADKLFVRLRTPPRGLFL